MSIKHYDLNIGDFIIISLIISLFLIVISTLNLSFMVNNKLNTFIKNDSINKTTLLKEKLIVPVTVTYYNNTKKQCDKNPCITASGKIIKTTDSIIAVSRDLLFYTSLHFGDTVALNTPNLKGNYRLEDVMNYKYNYMVDVLVFDNTKKGFERGIITKIN